MFPSSPSSMSPIGPQSLMPSKPAGMAAAAQPPSLPPPMDAADPGVALGACFSGMTHPIASNDPPHTLNNSFFMSLFMIDSSFSDD